MKSEKAKQRLYESFTFNSNIGIDRKAAIEAVELAEQEAEERMREKAIEAHRKVCFFLNYKNNTCANTATECGEHSCYYMNYLIQKLTKK